MVAVRCLPSYAMVAARCLPSSAMVAVHGLLSCAMVAARCLPSSAMVAVRCLPSCAIDALATRLNHCGLAATSHLSHPQSTATCARPMRSPRARGEALNARDHVFHQGVLLKGRHGQLLAARHLVYSCWLFSCSADALARTYAGAVHVSDRSVPYGSNPHRASVVTVHVLY